MDVGGSIARWVLFAALLAVTGVCTVRWLLPVGGAAPARRADVRRMLGTVGAGAAALAALALAALFLIQLRAFRDPFAPLEEDVELLLRSSWGTAWLAGLVGTGLAAMVFLRAGGGGIDDRRSGTWLLAGILSAALAFQPAFSGHAMSGPVPWSLMADGLHVLAAGVWLGSLPLLLLLTVRRLRRDGDARAAAHMLTAFTPLALASAGALAATGVFAAWVHLPGFGALLGSSYGRILLLKLVLVLGVMGLGAVNWRRNVPRLRDQAEPGAILRAGLVEWVLSQAVLAATAWLVHTPPP